MNEFRFIEKLKWASMQAYDSSDEESTYCDEVSVIADAIASRLKKSRPSPDLETSSVVKISKIADFSTSDLPDDQCTEDCERASTPVLNPAQLFDITPVRDS